MGSHGYVAKDMTGAVCVVTGANSGIGLAAARELARRGAVLAMMCRSRERGERARNDIVAETGNRSVSLFLSDFAELAQVRASVERIRRTYDRIDVLVNNAGIIADRRLITVDGNELTFQVNHLAHFLLTTSLLDRISASGEGRVITVSSDAHRHWADEIRFDDLNFERSWTPLRSYGHSKLANVMFTYELARREAGRLTSNAAHPGSVRTGFGREGFGLAGLGWKLIRPFLRSPEKGAKTIVYLAVAAEVDGISGGYFFDMKPVPSSPASYDQSAGVRLWRTSTELTAVA